MGFARVSSNLTVVDFFLVVWLPVGPSGAMDSASDFGSGGWGFESPLGLEFFWCVFVCWSHCGWVMARKASLAEWLRRWL